MGRVLGDKMAEFFVDVRCLVSASNLATAINKVENELVEYIMNSDVILEHDYIRAKQRRDDFYDD